MFVVMTRVKLREGTSEECAELFRRTNPELVKNEGDWLGAQMLFDEYSNIVTVLAKWKNAESYRKISAGAEFQTTMQAFGAFFAAPPEVTTSQVLVEMSPASI